MNKRLHEICYLCGQVGAMTQEHIPPKNLAPRSPRSDFKFVPSCSTCNNLYAREEEKFRDLLVLGAAQGIAAADDAWEAMKRNFARNDLGRAGKPHKDKLRLLNSIAQRDFYTPGGIYLSSVQVMQRPADVNTEAVLLKIARGLHYYYTKTRIPDEYLKAAKFVEVHDPEALNLVHQAGHTDDFFHYAGAWSADRRSGLWCMEFYQRVKAMAMFVCPPELRQPAST